MTDLWGKVALITGGARGMGASHATALAEAGATVVISDLLEKEGRNLASALGTSATFMRHDVGNEDDWDAVIAAIDDRFGRLDIVVNNAAVLKVSNIADTTLEEFERIVRVNQIGTFLGIKTPAALMGRSGGGSIVNISSIAGLRAFLSHIAYASTKWAVRGMSKVAAVELAPAKIRVNSIHPGAIATVMIENLPPGSIEKAAELTPLKRLGQPDEIAKLVLFLASDASRYVTGTEIAIDGGWSA